MATLASDTLQSIITLIQERLSPLAIYLYGSQAIGQAQPDSDLDIAVLGATPYDPWALFTLTQELVALQETFQNHPPTEVDLVDLAAAAPMLRAIVVSQGRRVFCADRLGCDLFEIRALKEYAYLQEERRLIVEDIRRRGRVYG